MQYDEILEAAPVTNQMAFGIVLTLMMMARWMSELMDVRDAFLNGYFLKKRLLTCIIPSWMATFTF